MKDLSNLLLEKLKINKETKVSSLAEKLCYAIDTDDKEVLDCIDKWINKYDIEKVFICVEDDDDYNFINSRRDSYLILLSKQTEKEMDTLGSKFNTAPNILFKKNFTINQIDEAISIYSDKLYSPILVFKEYNN